ncbi:MAG: DUF445 domain-containing protein [Candidatus Dadabacteria bacterium]|nr:MAG: DUF445 domain-containing protein [Candidatus Dadabacteria bacterium]
MKSVKVSKSFVTNATAILLMALGAFIPVYGDTIFTVGLFAFSGAVTNWLAVYMLFEKVPGIYGSGIVQIRFEEFKEGIKKLAMDSFFTEESIKRFVSEGLKGRGEDEFLDLSRLYQDVMDVLRNSRLGALLMFMGGEEALNLFRESFIRRLKKVFKEAGEGESVLSQLLSRFSKDQVAKRLRSKIEVIVDERLNELTPLMVKELISEVMRRHLGWLVVWGGVFGGIIGLVGKVAMGF